MYRDFSGKKCCVIRFFDIVLSFIAIVILFPLMVPIMIGLKLTGEHDVFYGQERVGRGGSTFMLWKFATMLRNSPNLEGGTFTMKDDPRVLPMGKFLRATKINEIPQLINVLVGDMSIIGYRPLIQKSYEMYPNEVKEELAKSRPGLSGIGSIVFRNEEQMIQNIKNIDGRNEYYKTVIMPYKGELEMWYLKKKSVRLYWELILLTIQAVLRPGTTPCDKFKDLPPIPDKLKDVM